MARCLRRRAAQFVRPWKFDDDLSSNRRLPVMEDEIVRAHLKARRFGPVVITLFALAIGAAVFDLEPAAAERELIRDLATVDPAEVGVSAERLQRLDVGMQALVEDGKVAGIVTMLARHGTARSSSPMRPASSTSASPIRSSST